MKKNPAEFQDAVRTLREAAAAVGKIYFQRAQWTPTMRRAFRVLAIQGVFMFGEDEFGRFAFIPKAV